MPRIVPLQLLKCLRVLLDNNGGILSAQEVKRIAGLMAKYSKKLVSKCVYVQILKSTKTELLDDFMAVGGWSLVYNWLNDAIRAMNWPLVQEILELLLLSPVDVNRLKINSAPVLVKGLCRDGGNEGVRILAKRLVEQWLKIVTENTSEAIGASAGGAAIATPNAQAQQSVGSGTTAMTTATTTTISTTATEPETSSGSSDSMDSSNGPAASTPLTLNYTITSAPPNQHNSKTKNLTIKLKTVDKSLAAVQLVDYDNDNGDQTAASDVVNKQTNLSILDDSCSSAKTNDEQEDETDLKKTKSSREKMSSKRSEKDKDRDKDKDRERKSSSSSSHRSSSSSHKSSSSSSSSSSKSSSSKSSSHRSSSDKSRDKDKSRSSSSSSSSSKDKERSSSSNKSHKSSSSSSSSSKSSSTSSSSSSSSSSSGQRKEKEKSSSSSSSSKRESLDKDNKLMPPPTIDSLNKKDTEATPPKPRSVPIMSRKPSISIEVRRDTEKGATVKTYQSKFRSHGLTEEAPPPPSRKGLKKPTSSGLSGSASLGASTTEKISLKRPSPPPVQATSAPTTPPAVESKKPKIDLNSISGLVERPGSVKLIAPKKIQTLVETNLFSDALAASIEPKKVVKRKRNATATSPTAEKDGVQLAPLKFYQDTLDESKSLEDSNKSLDDSSKENDENRDKDDIDDDDIPLKRVKEDIEQRVQKEKNEAAAAEEGANVEAVVEEYEPPEPKKPGPGCGPDGPPGVLMLHRRKGPKKKLTWQPEDKLTQIRYFEVDRSERVNVTKQSFLEMKNMERYSERDALNIARRGFDDTMEPQMEWRPLIEVDNVPDHPNGNLSKQRQVQADREATTLRALYFSPDMIPASAAEAELEPHFAHDIPLIPMDDLTGNPDAVNDYSALPWPEPKGYAGNNVGGGNGNNMNMNSPDIGFSDPMLTAIGGVLGVGVGMGQGMGPGMGGGMGPGIGGGMGPGIGAGMGPVMGPMGGPPPPVNNMGMGHNPFQPFGNISNNFMPIPQQQQQQQQQQQPQMPNNMSGPPPGIWMNGPGGGLDMNQGGGGGMPPPHQNFMGGNQFGGSPGGGGPVGPFVGPGNFNQFPPMMMNGPGPGGPGPGNGPNGMMNGPPNGPMQNGRHNNNNNNNNNNKRNKNNGNGNWRSGGNNFQDGSGGNWRSAGSGSNRGGNTGICKQFMRGHCSMGKACKYVHPQKKNNNRM